MDMLEAHLVVLVVLEYYCSENSKFRSLHLSNINVLDFCFKDFAHTTGGIFAPQKKGIVV